MSIYRLLMTVLFRYVMMQTFFHRAFCVSVYRVLRKPNIKLITMRKAKQNSKSAATNHQLEFTKNNFPMSNRTKRSQSESARNKSNVQSSPTSAE